MPADPVSHRPLRFLVAGVWNTAFGFGAYLLCDTIVAALHGHYLLALLPAQVIAVTQAWLIHKRFVFSDLQGGPWTFVRYNAVYWVTFAGNLLVLPAVVALTDVDHRIVQAGYVGVSAVGSYLAHRYFSFG